MGEGARAIFKHVDIRADALGFRFGIGLINTDDNTHLLLNIINRQIEVVSNQRKAVNDNKTGNRNADCRKGHKSVLEHCADAFAHQITKIIMLHNCSTRPFRH